jgi:peptide/nickel transport system substrate-binding protein
MNPAKLVRLLAAAPAALVLAGCSPPAARGAADGDAPLRVVITADMRGTNPGVTRDGNTDAVLHHVVESLVAYRDDLSVAPLLARSVAASRDNRVFRFTLREGLRFHNGAPVTAAEVKWSWQRMLDPATGFRCRSWYDGSDATGIGAKIVAIETPDPATVIFRLDRPNTAFLDEMASLQCITAILHPASVGRDGQWIAPVGTGPYRISSWRRGQYVELARFAGYKPRAEPRDGYAGGRVALANRIRFMIIPEPSAAESALKAGEVDILPRVPAFFAAHSQSLAGAVAQASPQLYWNALLIQTRDPLLSDPRMRRAIAHAIDLAQLAAITTFDAARPNPSVVPLASPFHSPAHDRWLAYDPQRARALLKAAGYRGQPITIQTTRKFPAAFDNAVAIQAMLTAVGIDARLEVLDWGTQLDYYTTGRFQLSAFGYSGRAHPVLGYAAIVGSKDLNPAAQWDDPAARDLLRAAVQATGVEAQQRAFDRLHALMQRDVPIIPLYNEPSVDLVRPEIEGYRNWPGGHPRLWGVLRRRR